MITIRYDPSGVFLERGGISRDQLAPQREKSASSEVTRIKAAAGRLAKLVDIMVVLRIGDSYMGARAMLEAS